MAVLSQVVATTGVAASAAFLIGQATSNDVVVNAIPFEKAAAFVGVTGTTAAISMLVGAGLILLLTLSNQGLDKDGKAVSGLNFGPSLLAMKGWFGSKKVAGDIKEYLDLHDDRNGGVETRNKNYMKMVNHYYNLVTDFYEYGWGKSFHFGRRHAGESFDASLARHEYWLGFQGGFRPGMKVIDVGCGVGGPMRAIARFTGANIIGINNNAYQIEKGRKQNKEAHLDDQCDFIQTDFMHLTSHLPAESIDGAYAIEATCHAPDKTACFRQIYEVLKPGATFVAYEWVMTDKYDPSNPVHRQAKKAIEEGDSLPDIAKGEDVIRALKEAGFEVDMAEDVGVVSGENNVSWYATIENKGLSLQNFRSSRLGTMCTTAMLYVLEGLGIAPKGSLHTHNMLLTALVGLRAGGQLGIFTPMYFFRARKPVRK